MQNVCKILHKMNRNFELSILEVNNLYFKTLGGFEFGAEVSYRYIFISTDDCFCSPLVYYTQQIFKAAYI